MQPAGHSEEQGHGERLGVRVLMAIACTLADAPSRKQQLSGLNPNMGAEYHSDNFRCRVSHPYPAKETLELQIVVNATTINTERNVDLW
jgi:hypothetical protein